MSRLLTVILWYELADELIIDFKYIAIEAHLGLHNFNISFPTDTIKPGEQIDLHVNIDNDGMTRFYY